MKKNPLNTDKKDKPDPEQDTRNHAAGSEAEDIPDRNDEDNEPEEEPLDEDLLREEDEFEDEDDDDDDDD